MDENDLNLPLDESTGFDPTPFEGKQVKIADVKRDVVDSHYVPEIIDGVSTGKNVYDANKTVKQPVVFVITEVISSMTLADGTKKDIAINHRFYLQERVNQETGEKQVVISKRPTAKLFKFMRKMGVDNLNDLKGKVVTLTIEPSKDPEDDRKFLRIVV